MFDDDFIKTVLGVIGIPEMAFDYVDPWAALGMFIFSSRILAFLMAVFIWCGVIFIKMFRSNGFKETNSMQKMGPTTHQYHMTDMKGMYKMDHKPSLLGVAVKGFILPVFILFIAISMAMKVANV